MNINSKAFVNRQYKTSDNLKTRIEFHKKYSTEIETVPEWLFTFYEINEGANILELGSGTGELWDEKLQTLPTNTNLVFSDYSVGIVDELKQKYAKRQQITVEQVDIQNIQYENNTFDIVIANFMLYHVPNIDKAISEVKRVLKEDGIFYAATIGQQNMASFVQNTLVEFDDTIECKRTLPFSLENGVDYLKKHFNSVGVEVNKSANRVTNTHDLIEYIYSTTFGEQLQNVDQQALYEFYDKMKNERNEIIIPKEYGTFISKNR